MEQYAFAIVERLDKIHSTVIQAVNRAVLLVACACVERRLRMRLYMQTAYREVIKPHEMPDTNVVAVSETLAAYKTS